MNLIRVVSRIRTEVLLPFLNPRVSVSSSFARSPLRNRHYHRRRHHHHHHFTPIMRFSQQTNLNISTTWFLFNLVTTHVLHLWSLLLVHLPSRLWKSLIALFSVLHLVYGTNSPLIFASLVRHSLFHFHLSHMAVHHLLHHLHYHHLRLLLLVQSFILNLRLSSSANPFIHRPFPFLLDWFHGLPDHLMFLFCSTAGFVSALSRFSNALKINALSFLHSFTAYW